MDNESFNMISLETSKSFTYFKKTKCVSQWQRCVDVLLNSFLRNLKIQFLSKTFMANFVNAFFPTQQFQRPDSCNARVTWNGVAWRGVQPPRVCYSQCIPDPRASTVLMS